MKPPFRCLLLFATALWAQTLETGIAAVEAGRFDDAVRILTAITQRTPDSFEANFYLGLAQFRAGRAAAARPYLEKAAALAPANAQAWKMLGLVSTSAGSLDSASAALRKACDLDPRDPESCYYLARGLFAAGHYAAARAPFEQSLRAAPADMLPRVHRAVAMNFAALDSAAEAEQHFLKAIELAGASPREADDPRVDYGAFLFRQGRLDAALLPLRQAARNAPASARAHLELGRVLLHLDQTDPAIAALEKAVSLAPSDFNAHLLLGRAYLNAGRTADGERELRLAREGWPGARK